jgi:primary-amine oxidase
MQDIATRSAARNQHPLDGLSGEEIGRAAAHVRAAHDLGPGMRFETIILDEPELDELAAHDVGKPVDRRAFVATYDMATGALFEAVVSLSEAKLLSWTKRPGAKPRIGPDDFLLAEEIITKDRASSRRSRDAASLTCRWSASIPGRREASAFRASGRSG